MIVRDVEGCDKAEDTGGMSFKEAQNTFCW